MNCQETQYYPERYISEKLISTLHGISKLFSVYMFVAPGHNKITYNTIRQCDLQGFVFPVSIKVKVARGE